MRNYPENWEKQYDIRLEDYLVTDPQIGLKYHISWAKKRAMVWTLVKVEGDNAVLKTNTGKLITCKVFELRETNKRVFAKAVKRDLI